jgi:hypothetical protein
MLVDLILLQMSAWGIFQGDHWYIWHIYEYLIIAFGCPIMQSFKGSKIDDATETR